MTLWSTFEGLQRNAVGKGTVPCWLTLEALKIWLERDPHFGTHTFVDGDESLRVYKTKDEAAGYRLLVVIRCNDEEKTVERRWLAVEPL